MGQPVVHFEIMGKDGKKSQDFYAALFQWDINANNPMNYGIVGAQDKKGIGGGIGHSGSEAPAYATFYVAVADPQACLDKVVAMGGRVVVPVTEIPGMVTFAQFADPDGVVIGIVKDVPPPPKSAKPKKAKKAKRPAPKRKAKSKKKSRR